MGDASGRCAPDSILGWQAHRARTVARGNRGWFVREEYAVQPVGIAFGHRAGGGAAIEAAIDALPRMAAEQAGRLAVMERAVAAEQAKGFAARLGFMTYRRPPPRGGFFMACRTVSHGRVGHNADIAAAHEHDRRVRRRRATASVDRTAQRVPVRWHRPDPWQEYLPPVAAQ